jgi:hypothetical protein
MTGSLEDFNCAIRTNRGADLAPHAFLLIDLLRWMITLGIKLLGFNDDLLGAGINTEATTLAPFIVHNYSRH